MLLWLNKIWILVAALSIGALGEQKRLKAAFVPAPNTVGLLGMAFFAPPTQAASHAAADAAKNTPAFNGIDTAGPRAAAYEKAVDNARKLKKIGAYELAKIEYDRAMRLNPETAAEIAQEKTAMPQDSAVAAAAAIEEGPLPGSPQWRYDSVVALATGHFADRRFDAALVQYKLAAEILPEQTFPGSQIRAIEWELAQIWKRHVQTRTEKLNKEARSALAQKNYAAALSSLYELMQYHPRDDTWVRTQFANVQRLLISEGVDTDSILAGVKVPDVWDVIGQQRPGAGGVDTAQAAPAGSRLQQGPVARPANIAQAAALPYLPAQLAELFPGIDFSKMPSGQLLNLIDGPEEHFAVSKRALSMPGSLQLSDSAALIKLTCEGLYFNGLNMYLKVRVSNSAAAPFAVGPMMLSWKQKGRRRLERIPVSVSSHPVVQPGRYYSLVYVCRNGYLRDDEEMFFLMQERTGTRKWEIRIPGKVYNEERNKPANQL